MAIEHLIKHGDEAAAQKDYLGAISKYSAALAEQPQAFLPLLKRAHVHLHLCDYDSAKADISKAFVVAEQRGKRDDVAACHFKLGLVNYKEKEYSGALVNFEQAKKHGSTEPAMDMWIAKAKLDLKKKRLQALPQTLLDQTNPDQQTEAKSGETTDPETLALAEAKSTPATTEKSTSAATINKHAPLKAKVRDDWYQNNDSVVVTIFARNVAKDAVAVEFGSNSVSLSFPTADSAEYHYNLDPLFAAIDPARSSYTVLAAKVEVTLVKQTPGKWARLEGTAVAEKSALAYPTSARKAVDWSSFNVDDDDEKEDFFAKLYLDVDEDTRRAMMKLYVESNGTVLTTNWDEAKEKQFSTQPPEGMVAKKW